MRLAVLVTTISLATALGACAEYQDDGGDGITQDDYETTTALAIVGPAVQLWPVESGSDYINPERGFYTGYNLLEGRDASSIRTKGFTLALSVVNLEDYRSRSLDWDLMQKLRAGFAQARAAGIKLILRFTYNEGYEPDASKSRILGHINQLAPVLQENADVIAVVQGGFIGAWGEWHSSTNGLDKSTSAQNEIIAALLKAVPWNRSVQLRTPMVKNAYRSGATSASEAYTGSSRSRLGHHNDCFLASTSDFGTYASPVSTWKAYVAADTLYTPMGGETCVVNEPRTSCDVAEDELEKHHWTYLNRLYKKDVIDGWIEDGCDSDIRRRLGYRFVATRVAHSERVAPGGVLELELDIRNKGYAAPMNPRPVDVVLFKGSTRHVARLTYDARRLGPGQKTTWTARLRIPANLATGTWSLALRLPDAHSSLAGDPRYAIRLANSGLWSSTTGDNLLSTAVKIDSSASGEKDASATKFVALP